MPSSYDDTKGPGTDKGWKTVNHFKGADGEKVNAWITIYPSPRSMGMSDAYEAPECWRENGKWFHVHNGRKMEIYSDYVTHFRPVRVTGGSPAEQMK